MRKLLALLFMLSIGHAADEFTDIDILGTVTIEAGGDIDMGGISVTDILISTDGVSSSDGVLVTAGYLAANTAGSAEALRFNAKVNEAGGITAGQVVYISGATGGFPQVSLSDNTDFTKGDTLAIANEAKSDGQTIICTLSGLLENIDTSAFTEGQVMYLGTTGNMTPTHPTGINAVQRLGHAVKINASTGSMIVELDPLTIINDHDGTVRHQLVNLNAGVAAGVTYTLVNDVNHRASISLFGSNAVQEPEAVAYYNQGYGSTFYTVDGNKDHVWLTDVTDAHAFAASIKMTLTAAGELQTISQTVTHTSTEDNDHAVELIHDAAGFGGVEAVEIEFATGAIGLGDDEAVVLINIDKSLSTGGQVAAIEVLATEGTATVNALFTGIGINPIEQFSGTFADADTVLVVAVDQTTALSDGGAGSISTFVSNSDTMTIGSAAKFEEMEFLFDTVASGAGIKPTFEFSTGVGTWAVFAPVDGTNGMRQNGEMLWLDADIPSWATGTGTEYLIRITRTQGGLGTTPITDKVQISAVTEFSWDENGVVTVGGVTMGGQATTDILISTDGASTSDTALVTAGYVDANAAGGLASFADETVSGGAVTEFNASVTFVDGGVYYLTSSCVQNGAGIISFGWLFDSVELDADYDASDRIFSRESEADAAQAIDTRYVATVGQTDATTEVCRGEMTIHVIGTALHCTWTATRPYVDVSDIIRVQVGNMVYDSGVLPTQVGVLSTGASGIANDSTIKGVRLY